MFGVHSFFVADDTGTNPSTFTRHPTLPGVWQLGSINLTSEQMIATADAISKSLSQPLAPSYATAYNTGVGSPALNFNPGNVADIADDTVAIGATSSWSRSKGMAFIAAVNAFVAI